MSRAIGVLALQGCIDPHITMLARLGETARKVRTPDDLSAVDSLILPGGESTTMLKLLESTGLWEPLAAFGKKKPVWGVCAGAILSAQKVENPAQKSLGLIEARAERNHYGSQRESFEAEITVQGFDKPLQAQFIRAPLLTPLNDRVSTLASCEGDAVFLRQGKVMITSFHVELGKDTRLHEYFLSL